MAYGGLVMPMELFHVGIGLVQGQGNDAKMLAFYFAQLQDTDDDKARLTTMQRWPWIVTYSDDQLCRSAKPMDMRIIRTTIIA